MSPVTEVKITPRLFEAKKPGWCPGCGDYGIFAAIKMALSELQIRPHELVSVAGIGCSGKISDYIYCYSIHTLHGRVMPVMLGVKLANPQLTVIGFSGDGDAFAIGMSHFIHMARRNPDLTYIIMDNQIYGLTKGQYSPTSNPGMRTGSSPYGSKEEPIDGAAVALSAGATFVARGFSGDPKGLKEIFVRAIRHRGFSVVDVISPCVTFNRINTYDWYRQRITPVENLQGKSRSAILETLLRLKAQGKIPVGIFYEEEARTYEEEVLLNPEEPMALQDLTPRDEFWDLVEIYR